ncbi:TonB family protein [Sphingomonas naasensis]|nr:energy transducer TonB [Sphingomonas naasensis]NIJ18408.1 TonB family protein [Sphingomonas naasensis]
MLCCLHAAPASARQGPTPRGDPETWLQPADYPPRLRARGSSVDVALGIAPSGLTTACRVIASSGSAAWDREICAILRRRARFHAPLDAAGRPVPSVWQHRYVRAAPTS